MEYLPDQQHGHLYADLFSSRCQLVPMKMPHYRSLPAELLNFCGGITYNPVN